MSQDNNSKISNNKISNNSNNSNRGIISYVFSDVIIVDLDYRNTILNPPYLILRKRKPSNKLLGGGDVAEYVSKYIDSKKKPNTSNEYTISDIFDLSNKLGKEFHQSDSVTTYGDEKDLREFRVGERVYYEVINDDGMKYILLSYQRYDSENNNMKIDDYAYFDLLTKEDLKPYLEKTYYVECILPKVDEVLDKVLGEVLDEVLGEILSKKEVEKTKLLSQELDEVLDEVLDRVIGKVSDEVLHKVLYNISNKPKYVSLPKNRNQSMVVPQRKISSNTTISYNSPHLQPRIALVYNSTIEDIEDKTLGGDNNNNNNNNSKVLTYTLSELSKESKKDNIIRSYEVTLVKDIILATYRGDMNDYIISYYDSNEANKKSVKAYKVWKSYELINPITININYSIYYSYNHEYNYNYIFPPDSPSESFLFADNIINNLQHPEYKTIIEGITNPVVTSINNLITEVYSKRKNQDIINKYNTKSN